MNRHSQQTMEWAKAPAGLQLSTAFIDVWRSPVDLPAEEIHEYHQTLSQEEQQRADKFTFPDKFEEYVVTRGLLRNALAHVLEQSPGSFKFDYTTEKKPCLGKKINHQSVTFNVSHSHGQVLVAVSLDRNIGIDIEKIRNNVEYEKLAKRFFSQAEYAALMQYKGDQVAAFFATWTRKEAFVKAVGKGIVFGLAEFDVNIDPDEAPQMLVTRWDPDDVSTWQMMTIETESDYMATLVADGDVFETRLWQER